MSKPRAVLFDIGSTLWSSPAEDPGALNDCYGRGRAILVAELGDAVPAMELLIETVEGHFAGWEDIWREDASQVIQPPTYDYVANALKGLGIEPSAEALRGFTDALLETSAYTAKTLDPEPGMKEALAELQSQGLRLACVSNAFMGADVLNWIMAERGYGEHLEFTVSSCEIGIRKPDAGIYQAALTQLGLEGSDVIFVGDRLDADVEGPSKLGMKTVLTHQYRVEDPAKARVQPDAVIKHLSELPVWTRSLT